jgi:hypothetical protein
MASLKAALALAAVASLAGAGTASAAVGQNRTDGTNYDRTPSVVQDGALTDLFFVRSQQPCNRLALVACDADNSDYDLYLKQSPNGGKDYGPAQLVATNPDGPGVHRGRTIAATRDANGDVLVFWASGGNSQPLYVVRETGSGWSAQVVPGTSPFVMNVEAVTRGNQVLLYTEEADGIHAYTYNGATASGGTLIAPDRNVPKAVVDRENGSVRLTYVRASTSPQVDVYVQTSPTGVTPGPEQRVISEPGASTWDPALAQRPNGRFELYAAPDHGDGRQQIAETDSNDFVRWSKPHEITPASKGGTAYWDYWPEPFVLNNKVTLYYTSERATDTQPTGTGHIWTDPGQAGNG